MSTPALPAAGLSERWGCYWTRDGAFLVVALARTGHHEDALAMLRLTSRLHIDPQYGPDARYLLTGDRVSRDRRGYQVDGCGWLLWATRQAAPASSDPAVTDLRQRCTDQLLRATGAGTRLAAPSPDYWEQPTFDRLLGANAPIAVGLRASASDYADLAQSDRADVVGAAAKSLRRRIEEVYGPGYQRAVTHGGQDAAVTMLMPPFDPEPLAGVRKAWLSYQHDRHHLASGHQDPTRWEAGDIFAVLVDM